MNDITLKKIYDCTHINNALIMNGIMSASANIPFNVTIWTVFRNISSLRTELGHANIVITKYGMNQRHILISVLFTLVG